MSVHKEPGFFGRILKYKKLGSDPAKAWEEAQRQKLPSDPNTPGAVSTPSEAAQHFGKTAQTVFNGQKSLVERLKRKRLQGK